MLKIPKEYIIEKIKEKAKLSDEEIKKKIKQKLDQLSGLISEEGAAHIIANELGVNLMEAADKQQIKSILPGMRNVEVVGKVTRVFEVRTFETEKRSGKVGSFMLGDETGAMRIVCWGDRADILENLKEGTLIKIKSAYAKDNNGRMELHLNDNSEVVLNPKGESVGEVKTRVEAKRKKISELSEQDQNTEILGTIVSAFDPRFFEVCSTCGKRSRQVDGNFTCNEHGVVSTPDYSYVMNTVLDDGTENIRAIFFRNQMQHLLNMTHEEILSKKDSPFEEEKTDLLGKIIKVIGRATNNEMFSRLEFVAQIVEANPNPDDEIKRLEGEQKEIVVPVEKTEAGKVTEEMAPVTQSTESVVGEQEEPTKEEAPAEEAMPEVTEVETTEEPAEEETETQSSEEAASAEAEPSAPAEEPEKAPVDEEIKSAPVENIEVPAKKEAPEEEKISVDDLEDISDDDIYE